MKKFLATLISINLIGFNSASMVSCVNHSDDLDETSSFKSTKSDLQIAKQFLLNNNLTIDTIFANEDAGKYIDYLRYKHQDKIKNDINFLFNENEFEGLAEGEQQVLAILNHHGKNETVNVKFTILPSLQVANNILNQAEEKLSENIKANSLLATSQLNQATIDKIINLVESKISNDNVQVTWNSNSSLNALESNKENQIQVDLSIKQEDSILVSKTVEITLVDVADLQEIASKNLLDTVEQKLLSLDGEGLSENDDLSSSTLRQEIINLLQAILNNPQINVSLLTESGTLKDNNNEVKVKIIVQLEETKTIEREIKIVFFNIISSQKHENIIFLKEKLPEILKSVNGSTLPSDFLINNSEVWNLINQTINDPNVKVVAPPILKNNIVIVEEQLNIVSNNLRGFGRMFGRTIKSTRKKVSKPKIPTTKRTIKTKTKVKNTKHNTNVKKNPPPRKKDATKSKDKSSLDGQPQKDSSEQISRSEQMEYFQEKIEQAETLSQSFINQLVDNNISAKLNDYNIFALVTVGFDENAVSDIVPVKFINVASSN